MQQFYRNFANRKQGLIRLYKSRTIVRRMQLMIQIYTRFEKDINQIVRVGLIFPLGLM